MTKVQKGVSGQKHGASKKKPFKGVQRVKTKKKTVPNRKMKQIVNKTLNSKSSIPKWKKTKQKSNTAPLEGSTHKGKGSKKSANFKQRKIGKNGTNADNKKEKGKFSGKQFSSYKNANEKNRPSLRRRLKRKEARKSLKPEQGKVEIASYSLLDGVKYRRKDKRKKLETKEVGFSFMPPMPSISLKKDVSLRERMLRRLNAARFRYINEQLYSVDGKAAQQMFMEDPKAFQIYHEGYKQQTEQWPINPINVIIESIKKLSKKFVIADLGCGSEAKLAKSVSQTVHSFDFVSNDDQVVACNMAHVPLDDNSVDVAVFCLSLMGTNLCEYMLEANRILKIGGILKIAEVKSRFDHFQKFLTKMEKFHFECTWKNLQHSVFYFMDFRKRRHYVHREAQMLPLLTLQPCIYKKR